MHLRYLPVKTDIWIDYGEVDPSSSLPQSQAYGCEGRLYKEARITIQQNKYVVRWNQVSDLRMKVYSI